ncbi:hypothetical protein MNBD_GAMMA26-2020 [hydrothermal vent metagenome]|uniref:Uncharacterized protein n=1 Tax=hydrothermal vent metagenome TaxID=652676 RepID=A0A3B1AYZ2_9ZZZZ
MNSLKFITAVWVLLPLLLGGCIGSPYRTAAPVKERYSIPNIAVKPAPAPATMDRRASIPVESGNEEVQIAAYAPPPRIRAEPISGSAVADLMQAAKRQQQAGDMTGASATMERALRIEPRNAYLWSDLAKVRMAQNRYSQAEGLAAKSNALAAADRDLKRDNWLLIAQARRTVGNISGAQSAQSKAYALR